MPVSLRQFGALCAWAPLALALVAMPPAYGFERQHFPEGSPQQAVEAILYGDFMSSYRDSPEQREWGGTKYYPHEYGNRMSPEARAPWVNCSVAAFIRDYRVVGVVPERMIGVKEPIIDPARVFVVVQMHVLGFDWSEEYHRSHQERWCGWRGLMIQNARTGRKEYVFDRSDDADGFVSELMELGELVTKTDAGIGFYRVPSHRQLWEFGIEMYKERGDDVWRPERPYTPPHTSVVLEEKWVAGRLKEDQEGLERYCPDGVRSDGFREYCGRKSKGVSFFQKRRDFLRLLLQ